MLMLVISKIYAKHVEEKKKVLNIIMLKCREMMKIIEKRIEGMSVSIENIEDLKEIQEYMRLVAENVKYMRG